MSVVRPDQAPPLLTNLERRIELLKEAGVDDVVVVDFTSEVAQWSPAEFVDRVLRPLHPSRIVVGENFRFGFRAAGTVETLAELAGGEFAVEAVPLLTDGTQASSSTLIRHAVAEGDFGRVRELSDQVFRFTGVVVVGDQRGREMGFPTANVPVGPRHGCAGRRGLRRLGDPVGRALTPLAGRDLGRHQSRPSTVTNGASRRTCWIATTWSCTAWRSPSTSTPASAAR